MEKVFNVAYGFRLQKAGQLCLLFGSYEELFSVAISSQSIKLGLLTRGRNARNIPSRFPNYLVASCFGTRLHR
jgi:hypothetical protein